MRIRVRLLALALLLMGGMPVSLASAQSALVKLLFFHSPSCDKCEVMIEEFWPAAFAKYGDQLQVLFIDVSYPQNLEMWQAAETAAGVPQDKRGVPGVIIGGDLIIGDEPIKQQLYGLIDQYLAKGGVEFPPMEQAPQTPGITPSAVPPALELPTPTVQSASTPTGQPSSGRWVAGLAVVLALGVGLYAWRGRRSART